MLLLTVRNAALRMRTPSASGIQPADRDSALRKSLMNTNLRNIKVKYLSQLMPLPNAEHAA